MPSARRRVGHEQVVADQLDLLAEGVGQSRPALPVVLGHAVLDRDDRVAADQVRPVADHAAGIERLAFAGQMVLAVLEELGRGGVEGQNDVLARLVAGRLDRLHDEAQRLLGRIEVGGEAALVADIGVVPGVLELLLRATGTLRSPCAAPRPHSRPTPA